MIYRIRERTDLDGSKLYHSEYRPWYKWKWKRVYQSVNLTRVKESILEHKAIKVRTLPKEK